MTDKLENGERIHWKYDKDSTIFEATLEVLFFGLLGKKPTKLELNKIKGLENLDPKDVYSIKVKDGEYISYVKKNDGGKGEDFRILFTSGKIKEIKGEDYDHSKQVKQ